MAGNGVLTPHLEKPCPILGLDADLPDKVFVLKHHPSGKYGCYKHNEIHGLAAFSNEDDACEFGSYIELPGMVIRETSFDDACRIAQERPMPIVSIMILDDMDEPVIYYVR